MTHDCIDQIEKALKNTNTMLDIPIVFSANGQLSANRVCVAVTKRDPKKREKVTQLFASYCPFCGKKYRGRL